MSHDDGIAVRERADRLWRAQLGELLRPDEAASALGTTTEQVERLVAVGELLALPAGDTVLLPAFQFADGEPLRGLADVLAELRPVVETPFTIASWLTGPQPELDGQTPAAWLRRGSDSVRAVIAARRFAALLVR